MSKNKCNWSPHKCYEKFPACFELYKGTSDKPNPGNVRQLHMLARNVFPKFFDGFESKFLHHMSHNKHLTTNWIFSTLRPSGFRIGGQYAFYLEDNILTTPIISGDINPSTLATNLRFVAFPAHCLRLECSLQRGLDKVPLISDLTLELKRPTSTITGNLYNIKRESGFSNICYLHSVTKHLALGGELLIVWEAPNLAIGSVALASRYTRDKWSIASTVSSRAVDISYWQKLNNNLSMASTFAWNKAGLTYGSVGYQMNFDDANVRGMIKSDLSVGFTYTKYLPWIPCAVSASLLVNMHYRTLVYGLKLTLDPASYKRGP